MAVQTKTPQYSVKLGWNKALKRNDRVVVRVALHRIPVDHINVDVQKNRIKVDTLKNTRKFVLDTGYPEGVDVDENGASATEEYGYLIVQIPIKSPESAGVATPTQRKKQLEAEKQKQRQLKKQQRKAEKAASAARAAAIANMAGADADAVVARGIETKKLKRRRQETTAEKEDNTSEVISAKQAWVDEDGVQDGDKSHPGTLSGAAGTEAEEDGAPAEQMGDESVASGQYEELRQQYELVKDELGAEERAELEQELKELYEMEADPTGRGVEGAVLDAPLTKKKQKKKKKKRRGGGAADGAVEAELSSALAIVDEVAARRDGEQEKVVNKEEAKRAWEEDQKTKQRERKARKKKAKAALIQELRRNGQNPQKVGGTSKQRVSEQKDIAKDVVTDRDDGDVVTINDRKSRRKNSQGEAGTETASAPPKKRKRRDGRIESPDLQDDADDKAATQEEDAHHVQKQKTKKQKKKKTAAKIGSEDAAEGSAVDSLKKCSKGKKGKKSKKEATAMKVGDASGNGPESPAKPKAKRGSDGILREPRSSGKQLKRVSFSPKPETKSIPAVPFTRNKWLW